MEIIKHQKIALLFGVETSVGKKCLELLLQSESYQLVKVFTTDQSDVKPREGLEVFTVTLHKPSSFIDHLIGNDLFYCTNSFLSKRTYSDQASSATLANALPIAKHASINGISQFVLLSTQSADPEAVWEVNRLRGHLEQQVTKLGFWATHIFKPSFIIDEKPATNWGENIAEKIGEGLDYIFDGIVSDYRPIEAEVVAKAMVSAAQHLKNGVHIVANKLLQQLAKDFDQEDNQKDLI